jgi:hypothetical protein
MDDDYDEFAFPCPARQSRSRSDTLIDSTEPRTIGRATTSLGISKGEKTVSRSAVEIALLAVEPGSTAALRASLSVLQKNGVLVVRAAGHAHDSQRDLVHLFKGERTELVPGDVLILGPWSRDALGHVIMPTADGYAFCVVRQAGEGALALTRVATSRSEPIADLAAALLVDDPPPNAQIEPQTAAAAEAAPVDCTAAVKCADAASDSVVAAERARAPANDAARASAEALAASVRAIGAEASTAFAADRAVSAGLQALLAAGAGGAEAAMTELHARLERAVADAVSARDRAQEAEARLAEASAAAASAAASAAAEQRALAESAAAARANADAARAELAAAVQTHGAEAADVAACCAAADEARAELDRTRAALADAHAARAAAELGALRHELTSERDAAVADKDAARAELAAAAEAHDMAASDAAARGVAADEARAELDRTRAALADAHAARTAAEASAADGADRAARAHAAELGALRHELAAAPIALPLASFNDRIAAHSRALSECCQPDGAGDARPAPLTSADLSSKSLGEELRWASSLLYHWAEGQADALRRRGGAALPSGLDALQAFAGPLVGGRTACAPLELLREPPAALAVGSGEGPPVEPLRVAVGLILALLQLHAHVREQQRALLALHDSVHDRRLMMAVESWDSCNSLLGVLGMCIGALPDEASVRTLLAGSADGGADGSDVERMLDGLFVSGGLRPATHYSISRTACSLTALPVTAGALCSVLTTILARCLDEAAPGSTDAKRLASLLRLETELLRFDEPVGNEPFAALLLTVVGRVSHFDPYANSGRQVLCQVRHWALALARERARGAGAARGSAHTAAAVRLFARAVTDALCGPVPAGLAPGAQSMLALVRDVRACAEPSRPGAADEAWAAPAADGFCVHEDENLLAVLHEQLLQRARADGGAVLHCAHVDLAKGFVDASHLAADAAAGFDERSRTVAERACAAGFASAEVSVDTCVCSTDVHSQEQGSLQAEQTALAVAAARLDRRLADAPAPARDAFLGVGVRLSKLCARTRACALASARALAEKLCETVSQACGTLWNSDSLVISSVLSAVDVHVSAIVARSTPLLELANALGADEAEAVRLLLAGAESVTVVARRALVAAATREAASLCPLVAMTAPCGRTGCSPTACVSTRLRRVLGCALFGGARLGGSLRIDLSDTSSAPELKPVFDECARFLAVATERLKTVERTPLPGWRGVEQPAAVKLEVMAETIEAAVEDTWAAIAGVPAPVTITDVTAGAAAEAGAAVSRAPFELDDGRRGNKRKRPLSPLPQQPHRPAPPPPQQSTPGTPSAANPSSFVGGPANPSQPCAQPPPARLRLSFSPMSEFVEIIDLTDDD